MAFLLTAEVILTDYDNNEKFRIHEIMFRHVTFLVRFRFARCFVATR